MKSNYILPTQGNEPPSYPRMLGLEGWVLSNNSRWADVEM